MIQKLMQLNQTGYICILGGSSLNLVDKFTYLGSSVSSTEKDIDTRLAKSLKAIDRLAVIWKSDLTDKMKQFLPSRSCRYCYMDALHGRWLNGWRKKLDGNYTRILRAILNKSLVNTKQRTICTATYLPSRKLSKLDEPDMQDTTGEAGTSS